MYVGIASSPEWKAVDAKANPVGVLHVAAGTTQLLSPRFHYDRICPTTTRFLCAFDSHNWQKAPKTQRLEHAACRGIPRVLEPFFPGSHVLGVALSSTA